MIKAVIFDMDGVMFDTETYWIDFGIDIAKEFGYTITREFINSITGTNYDNIRKSLTSQYKGFPVEDFYKKFRKKIFDEMNTNGIKIKKGLLELLTYLKNNNYKIAIASSTSKKIIYKYLGYANIDSSIFDAIVSGEDFEVSKPNPDIYLKTFELLDILPKECIIIEDSNNGIMSGYRAGGEVVWIPDVAYVSKSTQMLATDTFKSLLDVIDYLENKK